jgi:hypothetical protein
MTGREKIHAAFSKDGTREIPAVICYEGIYIRDHYKELASCPWWYAQETDIEKQLLWHGEVAENIGQDWFALPWCDTREARENFSVQVRPDGVYKIHRITNDERRLYEPQVGGGFWLPEPQVINTPEDIDKLFSDDGFAPFSADDAEKIKQSGARDLSDRLINGVCKDKSPLAHVASPVWMCTSLWGNYEEFFVRVAENPELVKYACGKYFQTCRNRVLQAAALGAEIIWIEDCYMDLISPAAYKKFSAPYITELTETIRGAGMKSVYYYTGNISDRLDMILSIGADAVSFEESKKNFKIDIEELAEYINGRCVLFGNLDATGFLRDCSEEELKSEIARQISAGRKNKSRFVMSMGSPVTPGTSVDKVKLYCDAAHELGKF